MAISSRRASPLHPSRRSWRGCSRTRRWPSCGPSGAREPRAQTMTAYVVVEIAIRDTAPYERYKALASASIATYGGKYLTRGGATSALEGTWTPERFVILEFANVDTARRWWNSPE